MFCVCQCTLEHHPLQQWALCQLLPARDAVLNLPCAYHVCFTLGPALRSCRRAAHFCPFLAYFHYFCFPEFSLFPTLLSGIKPTYASCSWLFKNWLWLFITYNIQAKSITTESGHPKLVQLLLKSMEAVVFYM